MTAQPDAPATPRRPQRSIENFRGGFEDLANFMQSSWAENPSQPLLYTPEFLASSFAYPGAGFHLAPTLYEDSKIAGFIAGFPRRVRYRGKEMRIVVVSFLSVASAHKKSGFGLVLWGELVKRARAAGFDGVMNFCVDGEPMADMMLGGFQRMKVPAARVFSVPYLMRLILPKQAKADAESGDPGLIDMFLSAAASVSASVELGRVWSAEEVEWQCLRRDHPMVATHSSGGAQGILTGSVMQIADRVGTKCLIIEDILWNGLAVEERPALVRKLVERAASTGARMAVVPLLGYADPEPFLKSRFLHSPRVLHAFLGLLGEGPDPEPVSSFYVDVF